MMELENTTKKEEGDNKDTSDKWQIDRSMLQCNKYMFENELATDVTFEVSNKFHEQGIEKEDSESGGTKHSKIIKAHKYVLIARSPVFWNMFATERNFVEESGKVIINDVDPEAFYELLLYMYTDEIEIKPQLVMFILHVAKKYMVSKLVTLCTEFIEKNLNASNACIILEHSLFFDEKDLAQQCIVIIMTETQESIESSTFIDISQGTLDYILSLQLFSVPEIEIFQAGEKWARHACITKGLQVSGENMRAMLGSALNKIHFVTINVHDFGTIVAPSDILPTSDENRLFRCIIAAAIDLNTASVIVGPLKELDPYPYINRHLQGPFRAHLDRSICVESEKRDSFIFKLKIDCSTAIFVNSIDLCEISKQLPSKFEAVEVVVNDVKQPSRLQLVSPCDIFAFVPPVTPPKLVFHKNLKFHKGISYFELHIVPHKLYHEDDDTQFRKRPDSLALFKDTALKFYRQGVVHMEVQSASADLMPISGIQFWICEC